MLADRYDGFLIDLDGVMYVGSQPVPGATEAIASLRDAGIPYRFLTNTSSATREELVAKLDRIGITVDADEIISAAWATGRYLAKHDISSVAVIGNESLRTELESSAVTITDKDPAAVVVGHSSTIRYGDLTRGARLLHHGGCELIGVNGDPSVPRENGIVPGVGAILAALETAGGVEARIVGKPNRYLFEIGLAELAVDNVAMIGDMPSVDVVGAKQAGLEAILVGDREPGTSAAEQPDVRIPTIHELIK